MAVTVNRYPASGGSVTYWIENLNDTSKKIHFDVTVNAGHKLTYFKYSNDVTSNQASRNIDGPVTRTDFYVQSYGTESVRDHVFSVFFDGADPDHEGEYYDLDVIVSASPGGAGTVTAVPSEFRDVNVGVAVSYTLSATANPGYVFEKWENEYTSASSSSSKWTVSFRGTEETYYQRRYTALFRKANTYVVSASVSPDGAGTVNGGPTYSETFEEGSAASVTLSAVPADGFVFVRWTRTSPSSSNLSKATITRSVKSSETWVAEFSSDPSDMIIAQLVIHPGPDDHGPHGHVTVMHKRSGLSTDVTSSSTVRVYDGGSSFANVDINPEPYEGYTISKAVLVRDTTSGPQTTSYTSYPFFVSLVNDDVVHVFFGCGRMLHSKESGKLLENDGRLVYCG